MGGAVYKRGLLAAAEPEIAPGTLCPGHKRVPGAQMSFFKDLNMR